LKPKAKMKPLHWDNLGGRQIQGTVWAEIVQNDEGDYTDQGMDRYCYFHDDSDFALLIKQSAARRRSTGLPL